MDPLTWSAFAKQQFDKILLAIVLFILGGLLVHLAHHEPANRAFDWAQKTFDVFSGSLLTLITSQAFRNGKSEPPKTHE